MPRQQIFVPLILWLLAIAGTGMSACAWADDDEDRAISTAAPKSSRQTPGLVKLSLAQQAAAELVSKPLTGITLQNETTSFGKVLDIQPLLELRSRLRSAQADVDVAAAALQLAEKNRNRVQALYKADIIAGRELTQTEAQWQSDLTRERAARRHVEEIRREAQHLWGDELAHLALDGEAALLENLAKHRRSLLQLTLPFGTDPLSPQVQVFIARDFERSKAVKAEMISAAPRTDELVQGETWFFHIPTEHLRAGMRINVWVTDGARRQGVALPASAIVWQAGKSWVYRDNRDGSYSRLPVDPQPSSDKALFADMALAPGTHVVVTGAQTLLSEEFRGAIPSEDESR